MTKYYSTKKLEQIEQNYLSELSVLRNKYESLFDEEIKKQLHPKDLFICSMGAIVIEPERSYQDDFITYLSHLYHYGNSECDSMGFVFQDVEPSLDLNKGYHYIDRNSFLLDGQKYYLESFFLNDDDTTFFNYSYNDDKYHLPRFFVTNESGTLYLVYVNMFDIQFREFSKMEDCIKERHTFAVESNLGEVFENIENKTITFKGKFNKK